MIAESGLNDPRVMRVPEIGGHKTHGATPAEAIAMGADMVASYLDVCRTNGRPIPAPRLFDGEGGAATA